VVGVAADHADAAAGEHMMTAGDIDAGQAAAAEGGAAAQHVSACVARLKRPGQQSPSQSSGHVWAAAAENLLVADAEHVHWAVAEDVGAASQVGAVAQQHVIADFAQSTLPRQQSLCHQKLAAQSQ